MKKLVFYFLSPVLIPLFMVSAIVGFIMIEVSFYIADYAEWSGVKWLNKIFS